MKPTNEERREVAARLRGSIYKHTCIYPMCILHDVLVGGKCGPSKTDVEDCRNDCAEEVLNRLADLIEPEPERTCRYVWDERSKAWACSECGGLEPVCGGLSYCIDCGAKVAE